MTNTARGYIVEKAKDTYKDYDAYIGSVWVAALITALRVDGLEVYVKDTKTGDVTKLEG